jgi:hypothetical protein
MLSIERGRQQNTCVFFCIALVAALALERLVAQPILA